MYQICDISNTCIISVRIISIIINIIIKKNYYYYYSEIDIIYF